ncbi:MAG: chemotaxis protein CheA, partial [Myxococcaceae bacterium]
MDDEVLQKIWPIFRAEAAEYVEFLSTGMMHLEKDPSEWPDSLLENVRRAAHSLKGSAASLGFVAIEQISHAIEDAIDRRDQTKAYPRAVVEALLRGLAKIEDVLEAYGQGGAVDAMEGVEEVLAALSGEAPAKKEPEKKKGKKSSGKSVGASGKAAASGGAAAPTSTPPPAAASSSAGAVDAELWQVFRGELLEHAQSLHAEAKRLAKAPQASVEWPTLESLARAVEGSGATLGISDLEALGKAIAQVCSAKGPMNWTALADACGALLLAISDLDDGKPGTIPGLDSLTSRLKTADEAAPEVQKPTAAAAAATPGLGDATRSADRAIRVSENTIESLGRQIEDMTMAVGRQERRTRELKAFGGRTGEVLQLCEQGAHELRRAGLGQSAAALDDGVARLRSLRRDLLNVMRDSAVEMEHLRLVSTIVRNDLRDLRMVPASGVLEPLRRTVRDVASRVGKEADLVIIGGDVRLDRKILDELKDPLQHIVRNAVDHGLEMPQARVAAGKPAAGKLEITVEQRGHRVVVIIADDGGGLAIDRIRAVAVRRGLLTQEDADRLPESEAARLIFKPGFSTAEQVTAISGRGVGMDVVHQTITRLQGIVDIRFTAGQGTTISLDLPLTMAAALALIVEVGKEQVAVPIEAVSRVLRLSRGEIGTVAGQTVVAVEGSQVPIIDLAQVIGAPHGNLGSRAFQLALLLNAGGQAMAFGVDALVGNAEIVIHPLGKAVAKSTHLAG